MPSRAQKSRSYTPKSSSLLAKTGNARKSGSRTGSEANSRSSTPTSISSGITASRSSSRIKSKPKNQKTSKVSSSKFLANLDSGYERGHDDEYVYGSDLELPSDADSEHEHSPGSDDEFLLEEEAAEIVDEEEEDNDDEWSETSSVTKGRYPPRPPTPEYIPEDEIPCLELPEKSTDLPLSDRDLMKTLGIYEVLRHYSNILRISPFRIEDFCISLTCDEQCALASEIFVSLMKALLREEEGNQTWFGPPDTKDSVNIGFFFLDAMTWYECARIYIESDSSPDFKAALPALSKESYFSTNLGERLTILQSLTDIFLSSNAVREDILTEGNIRYDEHCRYCHKYV